MKKIILTIAVILFVILPANAQNANDAEALGVSLDELEAVTGRIKEKVEEFQSNLQDMAGRGKVSLDNKNKLREYTLKLFIGEGSSYLVKEDVFDPKGSFMGVREYKHEAVKMGTINSKYNKKRLYFPMTTYLSNLIKRSESPKDRYKEILIEAADAVRVDGLRKGNSEGEFITTAHIIQRYVGYLHDGIHFYEDYTAKSITIYIKRHEILTPEGYDYYWEIRLGDVDCDDIW